MNAQQELRLQRQASSANYSNPNPNPIKQDQLDEDIATADEYLKVKLTIKNDVENTRVSKEFAEANIDLVIKNSFQGESLLDEVNPIYRFIEAVCCKST